MCHDGAAQILERQTHRGEAPQIGLHAHGRLLGSHHVGLRHPFDLRQTLGEDRVGRVEHGLRRHGFGRQRQDQHRALVGIGFAVGWRLRQACGQIRDRGIDRGLHVFGGVGGLARGIELQHHGRTAERARTRHLVDARNRAEMALECRRDGGGHRLGIGARLVRAHEHDR